uniref:Uncharacterized protein n=1 Tax=Ditylenchus dipsaci TaxID=166011 RepID=A0A915EU21_9BILA
MDKIAREEAQKKLEQKEKEFNEEFNNKQRMADQQLAQELKQKQNPFIKFWDAVTGNHKVREKLNDSLPNHQKQAEPKPQCDNRNRKKRQQPQEQIKDNSKSLTLEDLLKFHKLSMLMGAAAIARDMFLHVSPECSLYIFVVRVMPAYRATTNPLAHCEEDYMSYDYLKRLEAIAFYGLPEQLRTGLFEQVHNRHTKWFKEGIEYQGTYAKEIMDQTVSLHPYIKNDYWLAFGMEGPSSVDADPHLNYYKQKLKNGANNTQFDLVDLPITDFGQGGDGGD